MKRDGAIVASTLLDVARIRAEDGTLVPREYTLVVHRVLVLTNSETGLPWNEPLSSLERAHLDDLLNHAEKIDAEHEAARAREERRA